MPTWQSFAEYGRELKGWEGDLTGPEQRKIERAMGQEAQKITSRFATRDLGADRAFSGWWRGNRIVADTKIRSGRGGVTLLTPANRGAAGVWTTVDRGRNQGNAAGFSGPGINVRTGITSRTRSGAVRRVRSRRARRWNGTTAGKNTATDAVVEMERKLPAVADKAVLVVTRKRFDVT